MKQAEISEPVFMGVFLKQSVTIKYHSQMWSDFNIKQVWQEFEINLKQIRSEFQTDLKRIWNEFESSEKHICIDN